MSVGSHIVYMWNGFVMESLLNQLSGDKNTLYFIGNGFDLFHGKVKSKFVHFYSWLNLHDKEHERFILDLEDIFPESGVHGNDLWTNFEEALGQFNIENVHNRFAGKEDSVVFDADFQNRAAMHVHEVFAHIPYYLEEWAKQIDIDSVEPILPLKNDSQYLTFNYTLLLENVYHLSSSQILHIHNSVDDEKPLITGHNRYFPTYYDEIENFNIQKSHENLSKEIMGLKKPVDAIIKEHRAYFEALDSITKVIVFGHSLSEIDKPYFKEVLCHVHDDTEWIFIVYDEASKIRYETMVKNYYSYFTDPKVLGVKQYKNKMRIENCKYIYVNDLTQKK